jgi:CSLREA domain-containing protein
MKYLTLIFAALILGYGNLLGQAFTKITDGDIVNDISVSNGSSWGDYNNDGDLDLFVANENYENNLLYANNGDGTFTKITTGAMVNDGGLSIGSAWGDYDNDGDLDLFVANHGDNFLYSNNGDGTFTKVTTGVIVNDGEGSECGSWGDYDNDGDLDLFVANDGDNFLYANIGDSSFIRITDGQIVNDGGSSRTSSWGDYDNDGDLDLFVANGSNQNNFLYVNNGDGTFTKITDGEIVNDGGASLSSSWGDYDNDGDLDLFVANEDNENNFLYANNGDGTFTKITTGVMVNDGGLSKGSSWGDYDNDGDLDLFVANDGDNFLYSNNGDGSFTKITTGVIVNDGGGSEGGSWGDYDNDGDLDLFVTNFFNETNFLYRNDGNSNGWLNLICLGRVSNHYAIGAKVRVKATINSNPVWQMHEIPGNTGRCSQNSLNVEFGLGDASIIDSLVVEWPSGIVQALENVTVNQFLIVEEDTSLYLVVNATGDTGDSSPGDGVCDDGTGDCTLRAAIEEANARAGRNIIAFNIPGPGPHTIQPSSALPLIFDPVVIDGTTEPDFAGTPMVELDGSNVSNANGIWMSYGAENSIVRGLVINRFVDEAGIHLGASGGHIIEGNYIGTDVSGTQALGNLIGVWVLYLSSNNIIGGTTPGARNLISGNNEAGISIREAGTTGNNVQGNLIGTDWTGTIALGNSWAGVHIDEGSNNNTIGGDTPEERNIISGNLFGVTIEGSNTTGNQVSGNFIGLDVSGTVAIGSGIEGDGVEINNAPGNFIGGTVADEGNIISGNGGSGIWIHGNDATGNIIRGNIIGLDATGAISISNYNTGITIEQAFNNVIGGTDPGSRNIISGNNSDGIDISGSEGTLVQGNFIGTDISGSSPIGNDGAGVYLGDAFDNTIGGTEAGAGNLISGNVQSGVIISSGTGNAILSNLIFSNTGLGIDLDDDGVTPNDPGDGDTGANNLQNFPVITSADIDVNGDLLIDYSVDSDTTHSAYPLAIEFFQSDTPGQGEIFIGEDAYTTTDFNNGGKTTNLGNAAGLGISNGDSILATATDNDGNTSEFSSVDIVTGIDIAKLEDFIPKTFDLAQNYPNPFNPSTTIRYDLPSAQFVTLKVYDILGREVATLVDNRQTAGSYSVLFDSRKAKISSGLYFYKITAGDPSTGSGQGFNKTRKMVVMK